MIRTKENLMSLETITHYVASQASIVEEVTDRWGGITGRWMATTQLRDDLFASPSELEVAELLARKLDAHDYLVFAVKSLMQAASLDMRDGRRAQAMELGKFALEKANGAAARLLPSSPLLAFQPFDQGATPCRQNNNQAKWPCS